MNFIQPQHIPASCSLTLYDLMVEGVRYRDFVSLHNQPGALVDDALAYLEEQNVSLSIAELHHLRFVPIGKYSPTSSQLLHEVRLLLEDAATVVTHLDNVNLTHRLNREVGAVNLAVQQFVHAMRHDHELDAALQTLSDEAVYLLELVRFVVHRHCPALGTLLRITL